MNKNTKIAVIALAGLVALGGAAVAHKAWRHRGPHGPMGFEQLVERYDTNKDGKISQEEIDTNRGNMLAEFDADKSNSLALAEFQNLWLKTHNQQMIRDFQRLDSDANGQITLDEYKAPLDKLVAELDSNKDGVISGDEMRPRMRGPMDHGPNDQAPDAQ